MCARFALRVPFRILRTIGLLPFLFSSYGYCSPTSSPAGAREEDGLFLGLVFAASAFLVDLIVVAGIVGEGRRHFRQPVLWVAYALLLVIPWLVGHAGFVA